MLRECNTHGYFRGDTCPNCGEEGRFLMNEHELDRVGRIMAGVLRHFPERFGVEMDEHGWVDIAEFVNRVRQQKERLHWIKPYHVEAIVLTDPKGRYQIDKDRVRATYGHSLELELDLPTFDIPDKLYYPVTEEELDVVLERGLQPTDRRMVHLSGTYENAMAAGQRRAESPIVLEIDARAARDDKVVIKQAGKAVYITDSVPASYLRRAEPAE
ncbi:MAG TPA: RNA 2'-phosphotransferase [Candidatus Thermoplasmatota archaeon]|nr:RNA 2'-phosphotransferase [Candidatus Thermoplasmatota archaeon]